MRVGVVGCGYWGSKHVRVLSSVPEVEQVVIIEPDARRRDELGRAFPGARLASSLAEGLPQIDAVVVATPARTHAHLTRIALEAGKHVLVEKPMATSTIEAVELANLAGERGLTLMVGHTFEYHEAVATLRGMIDAGDLGELLHFNSARLNLGLYQPDVNVVWDLAPHDLSIINHLVGGAPKTVTCWGRAHAGHDVEDVAYLHLDYGDVTAQVHVSWLDPVKVRRLTAVGTRKMVVYDDMAVDDPIRIFDKGLDSSGDGRPAYRHNGSSAPAVRAGEPLAVEDQHFVECAMLGLTPRTGAASGIAVTATLEAAEWSLRRGRPVAIEEVFEPADLLVLPPTPVGGG
ncbi:MAG TPA: Gfo/Idh/MocA family oxidoreductase [Acidimicrobiales bacterium]|nr:Gfo/Idh/MocA family oxidoreductase [Acidimicrobiales bacterium]